MTTNFCGLLCRSMLVLDASKARKMRSASSGVPNIIFAAKKPSFAACLSIFTRAFAPKPPAADEKSATSAMK
eukprot:CAMPEP_0169323702 /NCGR_PEP_ID=MMETSP1017-20121227/10091_1 /TAXON_ID=342587 /ORGANISM="Karlodinium micrum, Strain CCMP2283" /LENGTH=71 /DNA_ID=CAMNT_0009418323 /DNA_START=249 /DNA_END=461 /DNA_ORIENTATION=-